MNIRNDRYNETSGAGDASTSRPLTEHDWSVSDMQIVPDESLPVDHPPCPQCRIPGWHSTILAGVMTAVCGTRWTSEGVIATGAACYVIEAKNDAIDALKFELAEMVSHQSEVAA